MGAKILLVDDDPASRANTARAIGMKGHDVVCVDVGGGTLDLILSERFDVMVTNVRAPLDGGIDLCRSVQASVPGLPVVVCASPGDVPSMQRALGANRVELLERDATTDELGPALLGSIARALEHHRLDEEVTRLRREIDQYRGGTEIGGDSSAARELRNVVERIADTEASVLITGETGTGKEVVAKALHSRSARRDGPFVAINCAAVPSTLLEAELFGYAKGAFTGAHARRRGLLLEASGGTLFLDEIGDLPLAMQPKLLRALQDRRVRPLGGATEVDFDCRLVSATNRDLDEEVERQRFRQDLYYRLNVLHLFVPPLRARGSDVLVLAETFMHRHGRRRGIVFELTEAAKHQLIRYDWPGNVRELENAMESATALAEDGRIDITHLPLAVRRWKGARLSDPGTDVETFCSLEELERQHIERVLDATGGNKRETARILRVDRSTLYRKIKRYQL